MKSDSEGLAQNCSFAFHNIVAFECLTSDPTAIKFFNDEYEKHKINQIPSTLPKVILKFRRGVNVPKGFTSHVHKSLARWSYKVDIKENVILIQAVGNYFSIPMIHHMLVHHSLRYLASLQGTLMLHSSAISKNGKSILMTGRGGAGKTTTSSLILAYGEEEWKLHADDYCFIDPDSSRAYLTRSHLYAGLLDWAPEIANKISYRKRIGLSAFGKLRSWTNEGLKWPVRESMDILWPDREIELQAKPNALVFLLKGKKSAPEYKKTHDFASTMSNLLDMQFFEARHFINLFEKHGVLHKHPEFIQDWKEVERRLIEEIIKAVPVYHLWVPIKSKNAARELASQMSDTINRILVEASL